MSDTVPHQAGPSLDEMKPANLLIFMSDEHNPKVMGCAGHPIVRTPNLDALAARGTMFSSAYTTCPVCVPARAAFAVGKYVHQIGFCATRRKWMRAPSSGRRSCCRRREGAKR